MKMLSLRVIYFMRKHCYSERKRNINSKVRSTMIHGPVWIYFMTAIKGSNVCSNKIP